MDMSTLNWWAIIAATLVAFVLGFLWYGPFFGKLWMKEVGLTENDAKKANMAKIFGLSLLFQFIMAFCLAMFLNDTSIGLTEGAWYGFLTGFGWIFMVIGVNALFEMKSWKLILINGGFWTVVFTLMGLILGAWK